MARILLVEDNITLANAVSMLLRMEGIEVEVIHEGRGAIGMVAHSNPDVVVLDISLGDIDGLVVGQAMRAAWPRLPIIYSTGNADSEEMALALADRRMTVLQKPYAIETLVSAIETAMQKAE
ncbi:MAG: response regulator [Acidobacteria bacterium]|nr:response regulator [Acidobacteriota bacterium]